MSTIPIGKKGKHSSTQQNAENKNLKKNIPTRIQTKLEEPSRCAQISSRSNNSSKTSTTLDLSSSGEESPSPVRPLPSRRHLASCARGSSIFLDDESDASDESHLENRSDIDGDSASDNDSNEDEKSTSTYSLGSNGKNFQYPYFRGPKTPSPFSGGIMEPNESDSEFSIDECSLDIDTTRKATETKIEFEEIQSSDYSSSRKKSVDRSSTSTALTLEVKSVNNILEELDYAGDNEDSIFHDEESACSEEQKENSMSPSSTNVTGGSKRDLSHFFQTRDERIVPYDIAKAKVAKDLGLIEHKCTEGSPKIVLIKQSLRKFKNFIDIDRRYKSCEDYFVDEDFREFLEDNAWVGPWEPNRDEMQDWGKIIRKICVLEDLDWQSHECNAGEPYLTVKEELKGIHFKDLKEMKKYKENEDYFIDDKSLQAFATKKYKWKGKGSFVEGGKRKRKQLVDLKNYDEDVEENIKYYEDSGRYKKEQEEKERKKMKCTGNEKAKGRKNSSKNSSNDKHQRRMKGKVSKENLKVNKKSRRTKHNPLSSKKKKLSKRKEAVPRVGKKSKTSAYKGAHRQGQKFVSQIIYEKKHFYLGGFHLQTDAAMCYDQAVIILQRKQRKNFANEEKYETARQDEVRMKYDKCEEQIEFEIFKNRFPRPKFPDETYLREKFGLDKTEKTRVLDEFAKVTRLQCKIAGKSPRRGSSIETLSSDEEGANDENTNDQSFIIDNEPSRVVQSREANSTHSDVAENQPSPEMHQTHNDIAAVQGSPTNENQENQVMEEIVAQTHSGEGTPTALKNSLIQILGIPVAVIEANERVKELIMEYCEKLFNKEGIYDHSMLVSCLKLSSEKEVEDMIGFMLPNHKKLVKHWLEKQRQDG